MCRGHTCTCTLTVNAHPLCQNYYGCPNGTVTKHCSTGHEWREWQNVCSTRAVTVTVTYMDTLTEGSRGESGSTCTVTRTATVTVSYMDTLTGGGKSGSTCTVHVLPLSPLPPSVRVFV